MRRYTLKRWLLAGLIGTCCLSGCSGVGPRRVVVVRRYYASAASAEPTAPVVQYAGTPYNPSNRPVPSAANPPQPAPARIASVEPTPPLVAEVPTTTPLLQVVEDQVPSVLVEPTAAADPALAGTTSSTANTMSVEAPAPAVAARVEFQDAAVSDTGSAEESGYPPPPVIDSNTKPLFPRSEPVPARRSFVDLSAAPCFSHSADYSCLTGQVEYSRTAKEWRLRYTSVDEDDRYGGRVVLIEDQHLAYLKDGDYVRVHGHLASTDEATGRASYRIESFEVLHDPNGGTSN
jgi:hypothetical protein